MAESADKRLGEADTLAVEQTVALGQVPHSATEGNRGGEFPHGLSPRGQDAAAKEASKDGTDYVDEDSGFGHDQEVVHVAPDGRMKSTR